MARKLDNGNPEESSFVQGRYLIGPTVGFAAGTTFKGAPRASKARTATQTAITGSHSGQWPQPSSFSAGQPPCSGSTGGGEPARQGARPYERPETERHWDQVSLTLLTTGAAASAAAFFITGLGTGRTGPLRIIDIVKMLGTGVSLFVYGTLVLAAAKTVLTSHSDSAFEASFQKRQDATRVFQAFWLIIFTLALGSRALATARSLPDQLSRSDAPRAGIEARRQNFPMEPREEYGRSLEERWERNSPAGAGMNRDWLRPVSESPGRPPQERG